MYCTLTIIFCSSSESSFNIRRLHSLQIFCHVNESKSTNEPTKQTNRIRDVLTCEHLFCINCHTFFFLLRTAIGCGLGRVFFCELQVRERERERNELESIKVNFEIKKRRRKKRNSSFNLFFSCETCKHTCSLSGQKNFNETITHTHTHMHAIHMINSKEKKGILGSQRNFAIVL